MRDRDRVDLSHRINEPLPQASSRMLLHDNASSMRLTRQKPRWAPPQWPMAVPAILCALLLVGAAATLWLVRPDPAPQAQAPTVRIAGAQDAFSPNDDGEQDTAALMFSASQAGTVEVEILDAHQNLVRTLLSEGSPPAEKTTASQELVQGYPSVQRTMVWDGRDDKGKIVPDGDYYVHITATGAARRASNTYPIRVDTTPPVIRLANMSEEMYVADKEILIEGVTEPDTTVWLNDNPQPLPLDSNGGFQTQYHLQEGENRIELVVSDAAGNLASVVRWVTLILKPPEIIVDNPSDNLWINQKLLSVQGRVTPGTELTISGRDAQIDEDGAFAVDLLLQEGENLLAFEATDVVGNISTAERRVFLKTRPPVLLLDSVDEGMEVHEPSLLVVGQTEVGAVVRLNGRELAVDARGGFQGLVNLLEGENLVKAEATDRAGNVTTLSRKVAYATNPPVAAASVHEQRRLQPAFLLAAAAILPLALLLGRGLKPLSTSVATDRPHVRVDALGKDNPLLYRLDLSRPARVTIAIWNEQSELVTTLINGEKRGAGQHLFAWNGFDNHRAKVSPGTYEVEVIANTLTNSVKTSVQVEVQTTEAPPLLPYH
jgi:flagellar hook assembly protein FlgD